MKIKICFIISNLGQGGAERQFLGLIKNINKNLFEVTLCLYAINKGVFYKEIYDIPCVKIVSNELKRKNKLCKIIEAFWAIKIFLNNNSFDVIQTTLFMNGLLVRLAAGKYYNHRIVSTIRNTYNLYKHRHRIIEKILIKKSFVVTNTIVAANDFKKTIRKKFHNRVILIYNGIDTKKFKLLNKRENENPNILIGNVGRISKQKNQTQLVRVFNLIKAKNVKLQIIGNKGDQYTPLIEYINTHKLDTFIEIIDPVADIEQFYNKMDIFVLSSLYEGCPNVLFEAMLCECFCIISQQANTDNFIKHKQNGLVYDGTDSDLKDKMEYAISINKTSLFDQIRNNGYKYATSNFSMNKMVTSYENLYFKIVSKTLK